MVKIAVFRRFFARKGDSIKIEVKDGKIEYHMRQISHAKYGPDRRRGSVREQKFQILSKSRYFGGFLPRSGDIVY